MIFHSNKIIRIFLIVLFIVCICPLSSLNAADTEYYFKFAIDDRQQLDSLTRIISIDNVRDDTVFAYANENQMDEFKKLNIEYIILPHPGSLLVPKMSRSKEDVRDWDSYPTYTAYVDMVYQFQTDYPDLCVIEDIGTSVNGRSLLYARISDNVNIEENEPEVMYTSTMHGDETTGYILMLRLIDYLLTNYGVDSLATRLVDSCEIWINPNANPDGTYYGGDYTVQNARRYNANSVDLNRNFPDPQDGDHPDGHAWQPETVAMMDFAALHNFIISANFHGGVEVVNYPWDTWATLHADDSWYIDISRHYADSAQYYSPTGYMTYKNNGITNGYAWYTVNGGRQDYMNYWHNCREVTIELSDVKLLPESQLDAHWTYNKSSFLNYLENGLYGIRGFVTDAVTGLPLDATIAVLGHEYYNSEAVTDPDVGDYHRMLDDGTYDLEFSADGYYTDTIESISVVEYSTVIADMVLEPVRDGIYLALDNHDAGIINPDDAVSMNIVLTNLGDEAADNVTGILSSSDTYIAVTQASSSFGTVAALRGTAVAASNFEFDISSECPGNHATSFQLDLTGDGGYESTLYIDMTVGPVIDDFETGDFAYLSWQSAGDADWTMETGGKYEGAYYVKSGDLNDSQSATLSISLDVNDDGPLSFYYKVSSEFGGDFLKFYVDDQLMDSWSGEIDWTEAAFEITAGSHTFTWEYIKNNSGSGGDDCACIDYIVFPSVTGNIQIATTSLPDGVVDSPYSRQLEAVDGIGSLTWLDKYDDLDGTGLILSSDGILSGTPTAIGTISFTASVHDIFGSLDEELLSFEINPEYACGDVDRDGQINILDIVFLIDYKYKGGPAPENLDKADVNSDLAINILDIVYLINYKYKAGPAPDCPE